MPGRRGSAIKHPAVNRKVNFIFNAKRDISLLKTVIQQEVWVSNNWTLVASDLTKEGMSVTNKSVKDRCHLLMKGFRGLTLSNLRSSGTEEEFDERSTLLAQLVEFWDAEQLILTHGPENDLSESEIENIFEENEVLSLIGDTTTGSSTQVRQTPSIVPSKRTRLEDKRLADRERDTARDKALANLGPDRQKTKKQAHLDLVEEKLHFDLENRRRELEMREAAQTHKLELEKQELKMKEESQRQEFEIRQKELLLEDRRLTLQLEANTNNSLMLKLLESALKNK